MSLILLQILLLAVSCRGFSLSFVTSQRTRDSLKNIRLRQMTQNNVDSFVINVQNLLADTEILDSPVNDLSSLPVNSDLPIDTAEYVSSSVASTGDDTPVLLAAAAIALIGVIGGIFSFGKIDGENANNGNDNSPEEQQQSIKFSDSSSQSVLTISDNGDAPNRIIDDLTEEKENDPNRIIDDLTEDEDNVLEAYKKGDEGLLRTSLSKLVGLVRSTRVDLTKTKENLKNVGEEMLNLEDKYELEQNALTRKDTELRKTQSILRETQTMLRITSDSLTAIEGERDSIQDELETTSQSLSELEEERRSIRKLGRVAWDLSKERVRRRYQGLKGRFIKNNEVTEETK